MGKLRVYWLKSLNKLSIYPLGNTPSAPSVWTLLRHGVVDADVVDKPWNGSTRSMRYSAVLVGRLWGLLAGERTRVGLHHLLY